MAQDLRASQPPASAEGIKASLPPAAYEELPEGESFPSVVPPGVSGPEFTLKAVLVGSMVGILFGAANAYLGLRAGLTVSASIPAAVIGVAFFRLIRRGTLLETNIVQTVGSAGESLAAGVIFTLPVLFLWELSPGFWPIFPLAMFGGLLGVLFMIPLRRLLIVREHGRLTYPEGTACAEVIVASQSGGNQAKLLFGGMGVGALYMFLAKLLHLFPEEPAVPIDKGGFRSAFGGTLSPELLGVGYIIGPRVSAVMLAGGVTGWGVIIPLIYLFGQNAAGPILPETQNPIVGMSAEQIWSRYLRYIGAGGVAFGGLITLIKALPVIVGSFRLALSGLMGRRDTTERRTDRDIPFTWVLGGAAVLAALVAFLPLKVTGGNVGVLAGVAVVVFAFFFVTVSSRIVGLIGTSSNPVSGMTIATVLVCALLFGAGGVGIDAKVTVLTIGALVCISAAIAGDTSQDLKTGHLLGATPYKQQIGEVIGVISAAIAMSVVLALFREAIILGVTDPSNPEAVKAPQANLIRLVIDGVLDGNLPWGLVFTGMFMAFCVEIMGLPTLAFAVGLYLPVYLAVPIMCGGLLRLFVEKRYRGEELSQKRETGVLYASGLIAGAAMIGVLNAAFAYFEVHPFGERLAPDPTIWQGSVFAFLALAATVVFVVTKRRAGDRS